MQSRYKMIVSDMDDTLLNSNHTLSKATQEYLLNLQQQGYYMVLASGRPTEGMFEVADQLQLARHQSYIISYNGSETMRYHDRKVVNETSISKGNFDEIIDFCRAQNLFILTYVDGEIIYEGQHEYMNIESELTGLPMRKVHDLKEDVTVSVPKVMGVDYVARVTAARQQLGETFNDEIDLTTSKPYFLEFVPSGVSKGNAIQRLAQDLGIAMSEVIAFGDSINDISMLEVAGQGIAMDNARDEVKRIADRTTLSNDEDGIVHALKTVLA